MKDEAAPYRSVDLIPRVSGVNALLDGHSHSEVEMEMVKDKDGKNVLLTQTGTKIKAFGKLTISESGELLIQRHWKNPYRLKKQMRRHDVSR